MVWRPSDPLLFHKNKFSRSPPPASLGGEDRKLVNLVWMGIEREVGEIHLQKNMLIRHPHASSKWEKPKFCSNSLAHVGILSSSSSGLRGGT
jgi:hypothetical protein